MSDEEMWWIEYFAFAGILFLVYCVLRLCVIWDGLWLRDKSPSSNAPGHPVDTAPLSARVLHTREALESAAQPHTQTFKRVQLVNSRRQEIANSAYFRKSEPSKPPEEEHGFTLLLV
jgi:hypothetical protein